VRWRNTWGSAADPGLAAAADALDRAERHGKCPIPREPDHLARNRWPALHRDIQPAPDLHCRNRAGNFHEEAAQAGDSTEEADRLDGFQRLTDPGDPAG
jgi:hypothetical protein